MRTVVSVEAVMLGQLKMGCCDEETDHVWVTVLTWSGRRAYLTGASPFVKAAGRPAAELDGLHFYATLPMDPPPADPEPGELLEWPELELAPPIEEIEAEIAEAQKK